jgi:hypothetical protein
MGISSNAGITQSSGVPPGGTTDQVLAKASDQNYDTEWVDAGGGGTPGGSNTQVQFNDDGAFGGDSGFTYNKTTDTATLVNAAITGGISAVTPSGSIVLYGGAFSGTIDNLYIGTYAPSTGAFTTLTALNTLIIPTGTGPTVTSAGALARDSTNDQLLMGDGSAAIVVGQKKHSISFVLDTPTAADVFPIWQAPFAVTITQIRGTVLGGTSLTFNIQERPSTTLNSAGTNVMTSSMVADQNGEVTTTFTNAGIAASAFLVLVASALSGTVNQIVIEIDFTVDAT